MSAETKPERTGPTQKNAGSPQTIVVQPSGGAGRLFSRLLLLALVISILVNFAIYGRYQEYFSNVTPPLERYHSGDRDASDKIAVIEISGTIMPPFTERILKSIERAGEDEDVKGVVLTVDSPGGLVADSHQIYHALEKLRTENKKPIYVAMQRMAASGGYYIAMGAGEEGTIYVEPTTWTGSIGVIIPHYDVSGLAEEWKIQSEPLKTGPFKDALSPFREMTEEEHAVWNTILDDAFTRFIGVIVDNRKSLDEAAVRKLATGQVYTTDQALANGLVDKIGYEEDAVEDLKNKLGLKQARVITYQHQLGLLELLSGSVEAEQPEERWSVFLDATVPRAMYLCSWAPAVPGR